MNEPTIIKKYNYKTEELIDIVEEKINSELQKMNVFGEEYTAAWNSKVPAQMASFYAEDGSLTIAISSKPQEESWLFTPGGKMVVLIRAYQADPEKIGSYIPPAFTRNP